MFGISGGSFGGSGVRKYAVVADLPLTGVKPGTLAHVEENLQGDSALYLWSGTHNSGGWYKIATVNLAPAITAGPDASYTLPNDGSPVSLSIVAEDPEGLPITWSYQVSDGTLDGVAEVVQDGGTFTITADPAAIAAQAAGAFSITFVASDGVSLSAATSIFTLNFSKEIDMSSYTVTQASVSVPSSAAVLSGLNEEGTLFWRTDNLSGSVLYYSVLSVPFDLSSAGPEQSQEFAGVAIRGVFFRSGGTKLVISDNAGGNALLYDLSVANDLSTATLAGSFAIGNGNNVRINGYVTRDGMHAYFVTSADGILHYALSSAWNFSTAVLSDTFATTETIYCIFVSEDGAQLLSFSSNGEWKEYALSQQFEVSNMGSPVSSGNVGRSYLQFLESGKGYAHQLSSSFADIFTYSLK